MKTRCFPLLTRHIVALVVFLIGSGVIALQQRPSVATWITAWGTTQQALATTGISNATVRMIARVTIPGEAVRIRLDHTFGTSPVRIGKGYIAQRGQGAALVPGTNRQLTFGGVSSVTIPAGASVVSDPVSIQVLAQQDLAVSLYIPGTDVKPSQHAVALVTSYLSAPGSGDVASDETSAPFTSTTASTSWLKAVDVLSSFATGAIVVFGDSITDGSCSTLDGYDRWVDRLALRFNLRGLGRAVVNEGLTANTITRENLQPPPQNTPVIERLDRDLFSHAGVTHLLLFVGSNDINRGASAAQVIAGMQDVIKRVRARGVKILGATIIARHNSPARGLFNAWVPAKTKIKNEVDEWIRTRADFDAVVDFDKVVRDPVNSDLIYPPFNCDGTHPNQLGYLEMAKSVRLDLFESGWNVTPAR